MTVQAELRWTDNMQFIGRADEGPAFVIDSAEGGSGAGPMGLILMGVGGCAAMDVVSILKKRRSPFTGLKVRLSGERAGEHPRRYTHIRIEFVVHGSGVKPRDVERAIALSMTRYCSAVASLNAEVEHTYSIVEEQMDTDDDVVQHPQSVKPG